MNKTFSSVEIHDGKTFTVDHTVTKFEIKLRSNARVSLSVLKRLLQEKYEVVSIEAVDTHHIVD